MISSIQYYNISMFIKLSVSIEFKISVYIISKMKKNFSFVYSEL